MDKGMTDEGVCGSVDDPQCSLFWLPLGSVFLPGLGQGVDDRTWWPYSGVALGSAIYANHLITHHQLDVNDLSDPDLVVDGRRDQQAALLSLQTVQTVGFLSAYDTYRYRAVDLGSLKTDHSTVTELFWAPLAFERLARPQVWAPLLLITGLATLSLVHADPPLTRSRPRFRPWDGIFNLGVSANAALGEEAVFRGWLMSYLEHRWTWDPLLANAVQGLGFGLAHGAFDIRVGLGLYWGWMTQNAGYDLTDAVLTHFWWDVVIIGAGLLEARRDPTRRSQGVMFSSPPVAF